MLFTPGAPGETAHVALPCAPPLAAWSAPDQLALGDHCGIRPWQVPSGASQARPGSRGALANGTGTAAVGLGTHRSRAPELRLAALLEPLAINAWSKNATRAPCPPMV